MKKPDRESRDSRDSKDSGHGDNFRCKVEESSFVEPKHIKEEQEDFHRIEPAHEPAHHKMFWDNDRYPIANLMNPYSESPDKRLSLSSPRCSVDSEPVSPSPSLYLMNFQMQEKIESELANFYANGVNGLGSPESNNPISIRSFCTYEGPPKNTYRCKVCNNAYTHPSNFHRHYVTTHLQRNPYPCKVCHKKFNRKDNMTAHLRAVHGWGANNSNSGSSTPSSVPQISCLPQSEQHMELLSSVPQINKLETLQPQISHQQVAIN